MTIIQDIHTAAWDFRRKYSQWWATPDPDDCLRYAFTEAGELMDAWLWSQRPGDARNNAKERSVPKELADVAIMLVSAMPDETDFGYPVKNTHGIDEICCVILPHEHGKTGWHWIEKYALQLVVSYSKQNHIDLLAQVRANLEEIKHKHVPEDKWT
jgi:NTP pyrophosphatase (non-canonical NTP hydrolase)